jgi:hypothetical protein
MTSFGALPGTIFEPEDSAATSAAGVLRKAAALIRERGWHRGDWVSSCGGLCADAAINVAAGSEADRYNAASYAARLVLQSRVGFLWDWNDAPSRTKDEVIAALLAAADKAEAAQ